MNIGTLVEKTTQKVMLVLNSSKKTSVVTTGFLSKMKTIPLQSRKTVTMDNGHEFFGHIAYRSAGFKTFFCDPGSPRQKALVEKMNAMIHRVLPKYIDLTTLTQKKLDHVAHLLNNMPRKIFGYKTPTQIWSENL